MGTKKKNIFDKALEDIESQIKKMQKQRERVIEKKSQIETFERQFSKELIGWKRLEERYEGGGFPEVMFGVFNKKNTQKEQESEALEKRLKSICVADQNFVTANCEGVAYLTKEWGVIAITHPARWKANWNTQTYVQLTSKIENKNFLRKGSCWEKIWSAWEEEKLLDQQISKSSALKKGIKRI